MVDILHTYDKDFFEPLHSLLKNITVPKLTLTNNRRGFPERHRAMTFGITRQRFSGLVGLSAASKKYPSIYDEILRIGNIICPFEFHSIHLNNNVVCPKHRDEKNRGKSVLVSFGDYEGCRIVIEGIEYDAKYTPILFNGALMEHWNTNDLVGNKYSLVFFN